MGRRRESVVLSVCRAACVPRLALFNGAGCYLLSRGYESVRTVIRYGECGNGSSISCSRPDESRQTVAYARCLQTIERAVRRARRLIRNPGFLPLLMKGETRSRSLGSRGATRRVSFARRRAVRGTESQAVDPSFALPRSARRFGVRLARHRESMQVSGFLKLFDHTRRSAMDPISLDGPGFTSTRWSRSAR